MLTREDIEDVGFTDYKHSIGDWYTLQVTKPCPGATYDFRSYRLIHWYQEGAITIIGYEFENFHESEEQVFRGYCRNEKELRYILKLIGIL